MNLYLLRHGEAEAHASSNAGRQLTEAGINEVINVARQFAGKNVSLDTCLVSPALRAQQTADTFLSMLFDAPQMETLEELSANQRAAGIMKILESRPGGNILLVSHNPILSELLALLTRGNIDGMHILETANLACVSLDIIGLGMGNCPWILEPDPSLVQSS